jgi:alanyl-tRNA synthetase
VSTSMSPARVARDNRYGSEVPIPMQSTEIRRRFTNFFVERGHKLWPSSSLIPNDPTLLLTVAGMVQFKPFLLGERVPEVRRAVSVQKSARTVDIEIVGTTARHLTFFEMLGNFSFGDYFKAEAIAWAWELLTDKVDGFGLEPERLWATVYHDDDEAFGLWRRILPAERIQRRGKEDNYWDTGGPGPCGPSSEIYYDRGPAYGREGGPIVDEERYLEVWNLVFMQYERGPGEGKDYPILRELPAKNIDTGMGFERMCIVLQGVDNVFETDVLRPILAEVEERSGARYGADPKRDVSIRVVAEHARTSSFLIADGVLPSNEGRGYILRRLLRRAVRHLRLLGVEEPTMAAVASRVVATLGDAWPELAANQATILQVVATEEESFSRTLRQGSTLLENALSSARESGATELAGETAFQLHDTYGFPLELTLEMAQEQGLAVDRARFDALMTEQRQRARDARKQLAGGERRLAAYRDLVAQHGPTDFVGYQHTDAEGRVLALLRGGDELEAAGEGDKVELILDRSPFYAEGGGQVGDTGRVRTPTGLLQVTDTRPGLDGFWVHSAEVVEGEVRPGSEAEARVDETRRAAVTRSHSATHVLHQTLLDELGEHANQHGSLVDAGRLRFDFSHFSAVEPEQLAAVEEIVNGRLLGDPEIRVWYASQEEARKAGAIALFGEKYGETVRIVDIGDFSRELCGGTHVGHGSQVGPVRILGESSIGSNLRRIEALTGLEALHYYDTERRLVAELTGLLRVNRPEDAPDRLRRTLAMLKEAETELARLRGARLDRSAADLAAAAERVDGGYIVLGTVDDATADDLRRVATGVRDRLAGDTGVVVLAAVTDGKAALVSVVSKDLVDRGVMARDVLMPAARAVGGGAGGKGDLATAGGREPGRLDEALRVARAEAAGRLGAA